MDRPFRIPLRAACARLAPLLAAAAFALTMGAACQREDPDRPGRTPKPETAPTATGPLQGEPPPAGTLPAARPPAETPTVIARGTIGACEAIALDDGHVYWIGVAADRRTPLYRVPKKGGTVQPIVADTASVTDFAIAGERLVYADGTTGDVIAVPLAGGEPKVLARTPRPPAGPLVIAGDEVVVSAPPDVVAVPLAGGQPRLVATGAAQPLATDGQAVFFFDGKNLLRAAGGGKPEVVAAIEDVAPVAAVADDQAVYWADSRGRVFRAAKSGGGKATPLTTAEGRPRSLAVDATHLYAAVEGRGGPGDVIAVPKAGGEATVRSTAGRPCGLAADATGVYFTGTEGSAAVSWLPPLATTGKGATTEQPPAAPVPPAPSAKPVVK